MKRTLALLLPLAVLAAAIAVRAIDPLPLAELRGRVFDGYQRALPRPVPDVPVVIVDIDDASLERVGQWPWSRDVLADLVRRLHAMGAAVIVFDMVFAEPDRTSPRRAVAAWQRHGNPDLARLDPAGLPDNDTLLAAAIADARVVAGFVGVDRPTAAMPQRRFGVAEAGDPAAPFLAARAGALVNLPEIAAAAAGEGSFNAMPDSDGVIRRLPLLISVGGVVYPGLAAEALRVVQGAGTYIVRASGASGASAFGERTGVQAIRIGALTVPTDPTGALVLYDSGTRPERFVPAWRALAGELEEDAIADRIVLIGTSAPGLLDQRASPTSSAVPGVELHAQALEQMLTGVYLHRPDYAAGIELLALLLLGLLIVASVHHRRIGAVAAAGVTLMLIGAGVAASWWMFRTEGLLYDPVYPAVTGAAVFTVAALMRYVESESEKRRIRSAFAQYMAPALVERVAEHPETLRLGGEMRDLTVLFCDVRGFTALSENFHPEEVTRLVNRFLTPMSDVIIRSGGTIDKFMGDCVMAFWNAPLDVPDHPERGAQAALDMLAALEALNRELENEAAEGGREPVRIRVGVGLNTGICCVGNMGSEQRFDYSCIGDEVNLASRLEALCKTYGVDILVGEGTRRRLPDWAVLEIDRVRVRGRNAPSRIFALLGDSALAAEPAFRALAADHDRMLEALATGDPEVAEAALERCRRSPAAERIGPLYDYYRLRLAEGREAGPADGHRRVTLPTAR